MEKRIIKKKTSLMIYINNTMLCIHKLVNIYAERQSKHYETAAH